MARKSKKKSQNENDFIITEITNYHLSVNAGRNYEIANLKWCNSDTKVFRCETHLEIEGKCIFPEELNDYEYRISVYGTNYHDDRFLLTLDDCHAKDKDGRDIYKTAKGERVPVYEIPDSIGCISKVRGHKYWHGAVWVLPSAVTDMMTVLPHRKPLYLEIYRIKSERSHLIRSISLRTENPIEE